MHGGRPVKAGTPCNQASGSFINAWGMACEGRKPMQGCFRKLLICMGVGTKRLDPHAKAQAKFERELLPALFTQEEGKKGVGKA